MRVLLLTIAVAGCNPHPRIDLKRSQSAAPETFPGGEAGLDATPWWGRFDDPALTRAVDQVLGRNLDLAQSWARLAQARARAGQTNAGWWPQVDASAQVSRNKSVFIFQGNTQSNENTIYQASVGVSYELDVWGRVDALDDAAEADVRAFEYDVQSLAMTLVAGLAEAWYARVEQRALLKLLDEQLALNQTLLELVELRFRQGLAAAVDVLQQQDQIAALVAQRPQIEARLAVLEHQIATIAGHAPGGMNFKDQDELPELPALPATGVPADVLKQRPDYQSAQARLVAADARVAAAVADRFPALRLTGSVGLQSTSLSTLVDQFIWSIAAGVVAPLFDGGRRAAVVEEREAAVREQLAGVGAVMLTALREVQDALVQERQQVEYIKRLEARVELARQVLEQTRLRYVEGVTDYLPVINALRSLQTLEQAQITARRQQISFRIQLHRALGGDWRDALSPIDPVANH